MKVRQNPTPELTVSDYVSLPLVQLAEMEDFDMAAFQIVVKILNSPVSFLHDLKRAFQVVEMTCNEQNISQWRLLSDADQYCEKNHLATRFGPVY